MVDFSSKINGVPIGAKGTAAWWDIKTCLYLVAAADRLRYTPPLTSKII
jgi:hypothetical protein